MQGVDIKEGDRIAYGLSNRRNPICIGTVLELLEFNCLKVQGDGKLKSGNISCNRVIFLNRGKNNKVGFVEKRLEFARELFEECLEDDKIHPDLHLHNEIDNWLCGATEGREE